LSKLIVIDRGAQQARFLECEVHGTRAQIRKLSTLALPESSESGESESMQSLVMRELSKFAVSGAKVVGLVGRSHAVLRDLRLPDAPATEMPGIVQLQAMRELSFPVEQAAIDYEVVGAPDAEGQRRVILAALQLDVLNRFQHSLKTSQAELSRVGLRPYATWRAYRGVTMVPTSAVLVVAMTGATLELTVGQGETVLFSRATMLRSAAEGSAEKTDLVPALLSEIRRTMAAFGNQMPGVDIERVALAAGPDEHEAISAALATALSLPVDRFDPFSAVELSKEAKQTLAESGGGRGEYVGGIGAAISANESWPIDFLNPKKPVVVRDRRKPIAMIAAAAVVLLVAGSYGIVQMQLARGRATIKRLSDRSGNLEKMINAETETIRRYQAVSQWKGVGINDLNVLEQLTQEHPGTKEMYVTSMRIERDRSPTGGNSKVVIEGLARQQVTVSEFNTKLNDGEHFTAAPVGSSQKQKSGGDFPYNFKSEITVKNDEVPDKEQAALAAKMATPSARDASKKKSDSGRGQGKRK
jgi:Tfp pilus assembly PilM family ATPase/Tfp pilus assembly protein PilN